MVTICDLKNEHKYGRFKLTMEECSKSQIATLNTGQGQFYGEKRFCIQPLGNNGILVGKGRVSRTSYSKSTTCPEEGGVSRTNED